MAATAFGFFRALQELQAIFEEWDEDEADEDQGSDSGFAMATNVSQTEQDKTGGTMTSQLRHFIAQPYLDKPLLLHSYNNKKFHLRVYVVAVGALKGLCVQRDACVVCCEVVQSTDTRNG